MKYLIITSILYVLCSCTNLNVILPESIVVHTDNILISKGEELEFEFTIIPDNADFTYDISSSDCQVSLVSDNDSIQNYALTRIESVLSTHGRYKAFITDLEITDRYCEDFYLVITNSDASIIKSEPIKIQFSGTSLFSISFLKNNNQGVVLKDICISIDSSIINIMSPFISGPELKASFETNGLQVLVNGIEQQSGITVNDFSKPVKYDIISSNGEEESYYVTLNYSGLPIVIIDTPNQISIPSKNEDWLEDATIKIIKPNGDYEYSGTTGIRGRGNTTWTYPKKPYALKFDEKVEILGMPKHKRYVLLANWLDRTLLRNRIAFQIALSTGMKWTPHGEFVEVVLNGQHIGNYYLCEQIKIDENRVNISELDDDISGGYLLELDTYFDETYKFKSEIKSLPYMFKDPDEVTEEQYQYIKNYIKELEYSLYDDKQFISEKFLDFIDIDTFIDMWFVQELSSNYEPNHPKSIYLYKDKQKKLCAGPVWDFDYGTFHHSRSNSLITVDALYYGRLFQSTTVISKLKYRWSLHYEKFKKIPDFIKTESKKICSSEKMNHYYWPIWYGVNVNGDEFLSFDDAVSQMKETFEKKLSFMNDYITNL